MLKKSYPVDTGPWFSLAFTVPSTSSGLSGLPGVHWRIDETGHGRTTCTRCPPKFEVWAFGFTGGAGRGLGFRVQGREALNPKLKGQLHVETTQHPLGSLMADSIVYTCQVHQCVTQT